jgi:hypothetical protein
MLAAALRRAAAPGRCAAARARAYAPPPAAAPVFSYTDVFAPATPKDTVYRKLTDEGVSTLDVAGKRILQARGAAHAAAPLRPHVALPCVRRCPPTRCAC